jgi:hypothetical protein
MGVTRRHLHYMIMEYGNPPENPVVTREGEPLSKEEALEWLLSFPPEKCWPVGECDNWDDEEGRCLGHGDHKEN